MAHATRGIVCATYILPGVHCLMPRSVVLIGPVLTVYSLPWMCVYGPHLGAQVTLGSHVVSAVALRAPADLAHQAELERVDGAELQLVLDKAGWI